MSLVARAAYTVWFRSSWLGGALVSVVLILPHRVRLAAILPALFLFGLTAIPILGLTSWMQCCHPFSLYRRCELTRSPAFFVRFVFVGCLVVCLVFVFDLVGSLFFFQTILSSSGIMPISGPCVGSCGSIPGRDRDRDVVDEKSQCTATRRKAQGAGHKKFWLVLCFVSLSCLCFFLLAS